MERRALSGCPTTLMARHLLLLILAGLAHATSVHAESGLPRFSQPDGPDRAEVEIRSRGCFHNTAASITLFRNPPYAQVRETDRSAWLALSIDDLASLDTLFDFYRDGPGGGCTTTDTITITWFRGNAKLAAEQFTDASCLTSVPREYLDRLSSPQDRAAAAAITLTLQKLIRLAGE